MAGLEDRSHASTSTTDALTHPIFEPVLKDREAGTDELVGRLADVAADALSATSIVYVLSPEARTLRVGAWSTAADREPGALEGALAEQTWSVDGSVLGWPVKTGKSVFARDWRQLLDAGGSAAALAHSVEGTFLSPGRELGVQSVVLAPLRLGDDVFGVLAVARDGSGEPFERGDLDLANEYASRAAAALEQARLTERLRSTNRDLQEAIRLRDLFINIASHELKTPLGTMRLLVEMLRKGTTMASSLPADFVDEKADEIGRQVDRMTKRVERLLDISRLTGGQIDSLKLERLDLAELIAERLSTLRREEPEMDVEAHIEPGDPATSIQGKWDRERMGQILDNLIHNARRDADSRDGPASIVIQSEVKEQSELGVPAIELIVGDPDLRIDAESHPLELEDVVRRSRDEGIGWSCLGLWIVEQLARLFGGELAVEEQPDLGTCYRVTIPRDISPFVGTSSADDAEDGQ